MKKKTFDKLNLIYNQLGKRFDDQQKQGDTCTVLAIIDPLDFIE
ncbi:MAG: hypothetical protein ACOCYO_10555 [Bacteroidota bacterium]